MLEREILALGLWPSLPRLEHRIKYFLGKTDIKGKCILEIGCGKGGFLIWCWANGAERCLGVEPETDGSTIGSAEIFQNSINRLKCNDRVEFFRGKFEDLPFNEYSKFDIVLLYNVVNHFDEEACIVLNKDSTARNKYRDKFLFIAKFLRQNGKLILADCARNNLFRDLRLVNPFAPNIEWDKHQNPALWKEILSSAGFKAFQLRWYRLYPLRHFGNLFSNKYFAYITFSHFILESVKIENSLHH